MPPEPLESRRGIWTRFLLGCAIVVVLMATATASSVILEVNHVASYFKRPTIGGAALPDISPAQAGSPETILVIGSDKRARSTVAIDRLSPPHSDTLMLIRMDPNQNQTSVLSIPRDLKVTIAPSRGPPTTQKINAAYSLGGAALTIRTLKATLPGLEVNHVVDVNFAGFRHVIDAIGCVYVYVDRRYFHVSQAIASENYASIDIQPGYQKLCDQTALSYARYRHTDSDFVRVARQQDFVRAAKQQISALSLFNNQDKLLGALQHAVQTDIHGSDVAHLIELALFSLGRPIRQVHFQAQTGPSYVTASPYQLQQTLNDFLNGNPPAKPHVPGQRRTRGARATRSLGLTPTSTANLGIATNAAVGLPFRLFMPKLTLGGAVATARAYRLPDESGHLHHAYVVSVPLGLVGEYYGVEGMDWQSPPILQSPSETRHIGGRTYLLYAEGGRLRVVAWRTPQAVYWVNNTLLDSLSNAQMLAIAESAQPIG